MQIHTLYIHLPFCRTRCPYCAFSSITGGEALFDEYADTLIAERERRAEGVFGGTPETIYIGGGTPSLFPHRLIGSLFAPYSPGSVHEITVEANPESLAPAWLEGVLAAGVNRLSLGVQAFDDALLAMLGRIHTSAQAVSAIRLARDVGVPMVSLDLMFGIPGQTVETWRRTLETALALEPDHISAYSLNVEEDTSFFEQLHDGKLDLPDHERTSDMYRLLVELLAEGGYARYEISNFARPGAPCRHNQAYWDFTPYLGIGASAHSFDGAVRRWNVEYPRAYCEAVRSGTDPVAGIEVVGRHERLAETVMLSLRTDRGLDTASLGELAGVLPGTFDAGLDAMTAAGYLDRDGWTIRLSDAGAMIADELIAELLLLLENPA